MIECLLIKKKMIEFEINIEKINKLLLWKFYAGYLGTMNHFCYVVII